MLARAHTKTNPCVGYDYVNVQGANTYQSSNGTYLANYVLLATLSTACKVPIWFTLLFIVTVTLHFLSEKVEGVEVPCQWHVR